MYVASINPVALGALFVQLSWGAKKVQGGFIYLDLSRFIYPQKLITYLDLFTHKSLTFVAHGTAI